MTGRDMGEKRGAPIAPEELMPDGVITEEIKQQNESEKWTGGVWLPFQACIHTHTHLHSHEVCGSLVVLL